MTRLFAMQSNKTDLNVLQFPYDVIFCSVHMFKTNSRLITQPFTKHVTERLFAATPDALKKCTVSTHFYTQAKALKMLPPFSAFRELSLLKH